MFFLLSKILAFLISPLTWIIGLLLTSLFVKKRKTKKKYLLATIILLLFFSNSFILDEFFSAWEIGYVKDSSLQNKYDYGIVLGGIVEYDKIMDRIIFNKSSDRILQAIRLYKQKKVRKLIIVGGSGSILHQNLKEADFLKSYLQKIGIPDNDIIIENLSRNTYENALFAKQLNIINSENKVLLITSAYHMRRSIGCFNKAGIYPDMYSVEKRTGMRKYEFDYMFLPDKEAFYYWDLLIHEVTGYIIYKVLGYI